MWKQNLKKENCVMWIQTFIIYIKTDDIAEDI